MKDAKSIDIMKDLVEHNLGPKETSTEVGEEKQDQESEQNDDTSIDEDGLTDTENNYQEPNHLKYAQEKNFVEIM